MALLNVGGPIPVQLTMRVVVGTIPPFLVRDGRKYPAFRAAEYAQAKNHAICWLDERAHEVVKGLRQQVSSIITDAKSNVKFPNAKLHP